MTLRKVLLPFAAGALALSLAACSEEDKAANEETPQVEENEKGTKEEAATAQDMQVKLAEQQVDKNKIVAVVNKEELTGVEYNASLTSIQGQMQQTGQDPTSEEAAAQVKEQALDALVNHTLILQKAKEEAITASEAEIDERYATLEEQFGGEKEMKKVLKAEGMDVKTVKEGIAESLLIEKYQGKVVPADGVKVTDKEIQEYYDQAAVQSKEAEQELPPLEEASEEIKGILIQQKQQEIFATHMEELKEDAKIELKI
ncbi:SurA N-terminal domain-containing protein [Psychrobacillus antarcticus]|uniref:SurA N-terminal domain-containing protein n=1 Tax=Psychrobacillus antarcticus TaxID=2879115 RepID=UPI002407F563|nr:SurA N-terminal domain-containing protein [Psychrobacillus antarcticus]